MKKKRNKGKKALTAVGAVVAAGLTPGIIAAGPAGSPVQDPNVGATAAEVVAIHGFTYSFDELFAMQLTSNVRMFDPSSLAQPQSATRYGAPCKPTQPSTHYGVQRPHPMPAPDAQELKMMRVEEALDTIQLGLLEFCAELIDADARGIPISVDSDLTSELGMDDYELKALKAEIEEHYGVEVSYHRFKLKGQLNTLRLITDYIVRLKTVWF
ncbi:MAG: acyl carrier protein [Muribaculaceae bacterium]|nr:acyl carrier protein [Muribaculaceae bacterium]